MTDLRACMLSRFTCVWFFVTLWIVDHKAPLSMGFSRQEYWSGWPCSPARNFPEPGIEPTSLVAPADFLPLSYWGSPSQTSLVTQTNLENILKSRDITTCQYSQTFCFSGSHVWMWELVYKEVWGLKNWCFELWCYRRLLRVPWTARRSNQEINSEYSLEGLMLKRKLQYFGHLIGRADSLENTLIWGKIGGERRRGWQRMRWLDSITTSMDMRLRKLQ